MIDPNERLQLYWEECLKHYPEEQIFGLFSFGSWTYGLEYERSDLDTILITIPSYQELRKGIKPKYSRIKIPGLEKIAVHDIRLFINDLIHSDDMYIISCLFSKYYKINTQYQKYWNFLWNNRESITHINESIFIKHLVTRAQNNYYNPNPSVASQKRIETFSYDVKNFYMLLLTSIILTQYIQTNDYTSCIKAIAPFKSILIELKSGKMSKEQANKIAQQAYENIINISNNYRPRPINKSLAENLFNLQKDIISSIIKKGAKHGQN